MCHRIERKHAQRCIDGSVPQGDASRWDGRTCSASLPRIRNQRDPSIQETCASHLHQHSVPLRGTHHQQMRKNRAFLPLFATLNGSRTSLMTSRQDTPNESSNGGSTVPFHCSSPCTSSPPPICQRVHRVSAETPQIPSTAKRRYSWVIVWHRIGPCDTAALHAKQWHPSVVDKSHTGPKNQPKKEEKKGSTRGHNLGM